MACHKENNHFDLAMELLIENGVADAVSLLMNTAMQIERSRYLQAEPYERTERRQSYANGYKAKTVKTRTGKVNLAVPRTRDCDFYPQSLERGLRSERALKIALAEMYVQGVSTRKVAKITEELCGFEISSSEVSRASKALDEQLQAWRERPLGQFAYVYECQIRKSTSQWSDSRLRSALGKRNQPIWSSKSFRCICQAVRAGSPLSRFYKLP